MIYNGAFMNPFSAMYKRLCSRKIIEKMSGKEVELKEPVGGALKAKDNGAPGL